MTFNLSNHNKTCFRLAKEAFSLATDLWGLNRSITGQGVRDTLSIFKSVMPNLEIKSVESGTQVFDWHVPDEWEVKEAYIIDPEGQKICDWKVNNLHIIGYSEPVDTVLSLDELQQYLHSIPEQPDAIPYVTSYYKQTWGFCLSHSQRENLKAGKYRVLIKSRFFKGELNYGELVIPGEEKDEILVSTYVCHPSMANNELSGPCLSVVLAKWLNSMDKLRYTYRFVFLPETIGSICYINKNLKYLKQKVFAGFNITCVGDERAYSYLPTRYGETISDKIALFSLKQHVKDFNIYSWLDRGSDERQYCAPGVDLPIASMMRSKYGTYPEYHTSLDQLNSVVTVNGFDGSLKLYTLAFLVLEHNHHYINTVLCEPMMSKRGLYSTLSSLGAQSKFQVYLDVLSFCDGTNDLLDICNLVELKFYELLLIIEILEQHRLIEISSSRVLEK